MMEMRTNDAPPAREMGRYRSMPDFGTVTTREFIIQPTSFCNLACDYCYLPARQVRRRMSRATLRRVLRAIFSSTLLGPEVRIVWHAGEPLALPIHFYEEAWQFVTQYNQRHLPVTFVFQTNGTLITQRWCDFINAHRVHLSISLDGPQTIHDQQRRTRDGRGTFARIMQSIDLLRANNIFPTILMVLTREALAEPDAIWQFFRACGIKKVRFLLEEALTEDGEIPLATPEDLAAYRAFLRRILVLRGTGQHPPFIGGIDDLTRHIMTAQHPLYNQANVPLAVISFDCDGNFSTFSPELLTLKHSRFPGFVFGNVFHDRLEDMLAHPTFRQVNTEVRQGVAHCLTACAYFSFCGGGSPVNKLSETGSFAATATTHCRLRIQATVDILLEHLAKAGPVHT